MKDFCLPLLAVSVITLNTQKLASQSRNMVPIRKLLEIIKQCDER